jgi:hypothetical protein
MRFSEYGSDFPTTHLNIWMLCAAGLDKVLSG